ncbi:hypothetical protein J14TS2_16470 [Bacillus sp. J14TS2]|uniref:hypothetical protein n=1 Tax=Bacillus sp. J14TS2 TaxID=2807188 RepID=UPI001B033D2D|nr:hypothetical protein [Bacillus sp. J14TS2]GIN71172.1 hypothetical protein J14TS2_16470 [Bacillus sp. J14TS2]
MPLKKVFVIEFNGFIVSEKMDHYPSEDEILKLIQKHFPNGFIYDQFSDEYIYSEAHVKKYFMLNDKESI